MQSFNLHMFIANQSSITEINSDSLIMKSNPHGGEILIKGQPGKVSGLTWNKHKYLVLDVTNYEKWLMGIVLKFWKIDNKTEIPDMTVTMGVIPELKTRLCLPLKVLNGQSVFLERTPGKLKTVVSGNKVDINQINRFAIGTMKCFQSQTVKIENICLCDKEPQYLISDTKLIDEFGQLTIKQWDGKVNNMEELVSYLQNESKKDNKTEFCSKLSKYGGYKGKKFESTGYFRVECDNNRWWLVDPEGNAFYSSGIDCVRPGDDGVVQNITSLYKWLPDKFGKYEEAWTHREGQWEGDYFNFHKANLISVFGEQWKEKWEGITRHRMIEWGFNTIGNWSELEFIMHAKLPYVIPLKGFPTTKNTIFRDFPDVFSSEYKENSKKFAQQLQKVKNDPYLIGYFMRNEPQWAFINNLNIARELLENENEFKSKKVFIDFLKNRYKNDIIKFNEIWDTNLKNFDELIENGIKRDCKLSAVAEKDLKDFSGIMIEQYVKVPAVELKKVDCNHLNLGMRYAFINNMDLLSGAKYFDVFSFNCYKIDPSDDITQIGKVTGKPVMIGEFHFGALDVGMISTGLKGVKNQTERGNAYRFYVENAATNNYCIGAHYFILNDQPGLGRFDGENMQIGIVDICQKPYDEFIKKVVQTNKEIYDIILSNKKKYDVLPKQIPRVGF